MELYHFLNKCSLYKSSLESKSNRYCSEPDLLNWYWSELCPGEAVQLARSDKLCDECYFAFQKLKNQSANITLDSDLIYSFYLKIILLTPAMITELQLTERSTVQCHFASTMWSYLPF